MANEKNTNFRLLITKTGQTFDLNFDTKVEDLSGTQAISNVQSVGTSWEAITIGDLASVDLLALRNADSTNFIEIATANDDSGVFAKLTPGRGCLIAGKAGVTYYAKADTAACDLQVVAVEP